ncbi:hypothetical protein E2C01_034866 [Portunus trituberculatus]|uniref:Uncharacterized protein n=1 Tax=Portunus trituberculatus TaxID=210409 RepID=A0A5B7F835_PORTR|nr:hypothetical protein [Portunus trituberculatus]
MLPSAIHIHPHSHVIPLCPLVQESEEFGKKNQQPMYTGPCYVPERNLVRAAQVLDNTVRADVTPCVWPFPQILLKRPVVLPLAHGV